MGAYSNMVNVMEVSYPDPHGCPPERGFGYFRVISWHKKYVA